MMRAGRVLLGTCALVASVCACGRTPAGPPRATPVAQPVAAPAEPARAVRPPRVEPAAVVADDGSEPEALLPEWALGIPGAALSPPLPDAFLDQLTEVFLPAPSGESAEVLAACAGVADALARGDTPARAAAVERAAGLGAPLARHLDRLILERRRNGVGRVTGALAAARAACQAKGVDPATVRWEAPLGEFQQPVVVLARTLLTGSAAEVETATRGLAAIPEGTLVFLPKVARDILLESARPALLAAQTRVWTAGDLRAVFSWLAARLQRALRVDRTVLAESPRPLRARDFVEADLLLNWVGSEMQLDTMDRGDALVVWRSRQPGRDGQAFIAEFDATAPAATLYALVAQRGRFAVTLGAGVDGAAPIHAMVRETSWEAAVRSLAKVAGHHLAGDATAGFTVQPAR